MTAGFFGSGAIPVCCGRNYAGNARRDLRECLVTGKTFSSGFSCWAQGSTLQSMFVHLASEADNEYAKIDSAIVRVSQHGAEPRKKN